MSRFLVAVSLAAAPLVRCDHWAVLIAGSRSYSNYRHQADVCHAYQVLTKSGFDPSKIITMLYDDVANSSMNPYPGKLYNYPYKTIDEAVDVYAGCKKDYIGKDVTPEKFIAVLTGDEQTAGGKVLKSTGDDHVFVNFVDHGGVGIIAFPGDDVLHANKLTAALKKMHESGMYGKLTFYLETCESGSMFEDQLPADLPVYALTAANAKESSWGTYCGSESMVGGKDVKSCLGDLFSVNWMQDSEKAGMKETLEKQFEAVRATTNKSHVMQYGQAKAFGSLPIGSFEGNVDVDALRASPDFKHTRGSVSARDATLESLYRDFVATNSAEASARLIEEIEGRRASSALGVAIADHVFASGLVSAPAPDSFWQHAACHEQVVEAFGARCGWSERRLPLARTFHALCDRTIGDAKPVLAAVAAACPVKPAAEELVV